MFGYAQSQGPTRDGGAVECPLSLVTQASLGPAVGQQALGHHLSELENVCESVHHKLSEWSKPSIQDGSHVKG